MKPYSIDLRTRIVGFVTDGGSKADASSKFKVCYKTVQRYASKAKRGESLAPAPRGGSAKRVSDERLRQEAKRRPEATLEEHGRSLGVSHVTVWRRLRELAITLKKNS